MYAPPVVQRLEGGRLHLQQGPIDVVLRAWGPPGAVRAAEEAAIAAFPAILPGLAAELPLLRRPVGALPLGAVARRMQAACRPFGALGIFVTPMAAVAGAVADALLAAMRAAAPGLDRAFVNDGGDIAILPGEGLRIGLAQGPAGGFDGGVLLRQADGVGGIATSGRHGRSFSLGIADAVTVLAADAATADAAATLVANAVDVPSPAIARRPAEALDPDSDLGTRPVTVAVGPLSAAEIDAALAEGALRAEDFRARGLIRAAALRLAGRHRLVGHPLALETSP
ncbi:UPF0280 family protein [Falsiroseomonas selenitidurans]|uniref:UPF0280 family protein n=1 Tax=Falsiroseomonas selenitidurans TaxID=2716335 RepID=A0ABX1E800_9PROT|nr:UPF0280 family protein [Falsiroseomonas selenitidurans]NKC33176.1 UPF0280 family protein [Falsiroseomonas selenitidurans]